MMILVGTWLFDMIIGGISAAIDVLRGGLKRNERRQQISHT